MSDPIRDIETRLSKIEARLELLDPREIAREVAKAVVVEHELARVTKEAEKSEGAIVWLRRHGLSTVTTILVTIATSLVVAFTRR